MRPQPVMPVATNAAYDGAMVAAAPTWPEIGFYLGTFGLFFTCFFLFAQYFPTIAVAEIKFILKTSGESYKQEMGKIEAKTNEEFATEQAHH